MTRKSYSRPAVIGAALAWTAILFASFAQAQQPWPTRAVTLIVPFGPGASNDTFTRAIASYLSKKHGQPFLVENRPGAGGFIGASQVAKAAPDGYTFLESPTGIASLKEGSKLDLDPSTDLIALNIFARSASAMVVPSSLPVRTVKEFIDYAKKNPDTTFYGTGGGVGAPQQLHAEMFNAATGLKMKPVSYKSSSDAQTDLIAGRLHVMFVSVASTLGQIESGQLRLLAYATGSLPPTAPKAPTLAEEGVKGMEHAEVWWAMLAPNNTPPDILQKMNTGINEALKEPALADLIEKSAAKATPTTLEEARRQMKEEVRLITEFLKKMPQGN